MNSLLRISFHIQAVKLIALTVLLSISLIGCSSSSKKNYCDFVVDEQKAGNQKVENKTADSKSKKEKNKSNSKK